MSLFDTAKKLVSQVLRSQNVDAKATSALDSVAAQATAFASNLGAGDLATSLIAKAKDAVDGDQDGQVDLMSKVNSLLDPSADPAATAEAAATADPADPATPAAE
jgi:hypothetical protein